MKRWAHCSILALTAAAAFACSDRANPTGSTESLATSEQRLSTQWAIVVPGGASLQNTVLSATASLKLDDRVTIGDGKALLALASFGTQTTQVAAGVTAYGNLSSVASVWMGSNATVQGFVKTSGTYTPQDGAKVVGGITSQAAIAQTPSSWNVNVPDTNAGDVNLEPDQSRTLAPGAYGALTVKSRSVVSLRSGTYYFTSFSTEPQAKIQLDESAGPVFIYITGSITARGDWVASGGSGTDLLIGVLGSGIAEFQTPLIGTVVAPNGTVYLERPSNNAAHKGAIYAKNIEVFSDAKLLFAPLNWGFMCSLGDSDGDGVSDCQDLCPFASSKSDPGVCGCSAPDVDTDSDGIPNCVESSCTTDASKSKPGICGGCGRPSARAGMPCSDGICSGQTTCDGNGTCGNPEACSPDPGHCTFKQVGTSIYWICSGTVVTQAQALARCAATPGQSLVQINTRLENALVTRWIPASAWIGANDLGTVGTWQWTKGANSAGNTFYTNNKVVPGSFEHWAATAPNDNIGKCATLTNSGLWTDQACTQTQTAYVCEKPGLSFPGPVVTGVTCPPGMDCSTNSGAQGPCVDESSAMPASMDALLNQLNTCKSASCNNDGDPGCSACAGAASVPPAGNNCSTFSGQQCKLQNPHGTCTQDSDCGTGEVCRLAATCDFCDSAGNCSANCPATLMCGTPVDGCNPNFSDEDVSRCGETQICPDSTAQGDNDYTQDPATNLTQDQFQPDFGTPTTAVGTYPADPACGNSQACGNQGHNHPWCAYVVDDTIPEKTPDPAGDKHGRGGSGSAVQFDFDPNLGLTFDANPKALGEMDYDLEAIASLNSAVKFHIPKVPEASIPIINAIAAFKAHRCRIWTTDSKLEVFGHDFLPEIAPSMLFSYGSDDAGTACVQTLADFEKSVSRAKKALKDAQELLTQYNAAKQNNHVLQQDFCAQYLKDPPFGFPAGDCSKEAVEDTINRFIKYYENQVSNVLSAQYFLPNAAPFPINGSIPFWTRNADGTPSETGSTETVQILNVQFALGPIPMNLEVDGLVSYGVNGSVDFGFNPATLLNSGQLEQLAWIGGSVTPGASAGVSLFVGAGFSVAGFTAKAGVEGYISLGTINAPATAHVGIDVQAEPDQRPLPSDLANLASSFPLVAPKQYHFYLDYGYGVQVVISDVLSGHLAAKVRIKIAFFHKSWSKTLVTFNSPIPKQTLNLISDNGVTALGAGDWGVVQMPTPFVKLQSLAKPVTPPSLPSQAFDSSQIEKLFYDRQCTCKQPGEWCYSDGDCCPEAKYCLITGGNHACTTCRDDYQTCNNTDQCCDTSATCKIDPFHPTDTVKKCIPPVIIT